MGNSEKMHVPRHWLSEERLHDFQGPVQNQNVGTLFKGGQEFQDDHSRALKRARGPSKCEAPCNCPGHSQDRGIRGRARTARRLVPLVVQRHRCPRAPLPPRGLCSHLSGGPHGKGLPHPTTLPRPPSAPAAPGPCLIG